MSEKLYAWLLRLYPRRFREAYGEEALQLFRDRRRHERGAVAGLRLWLDLFTDLAISVPIQHQFAGTGLETASSSARPDGTPAFYVLESGPPKLGAVLLGLLLSLGVLWASVPLSYLSKFHPFAGDSPVESQARNLRAIPSVRQASQKAVTDEGASKGPLFAAADAIQFLGDGGGPAGFQPNPEPAAANSIGAPPPPVPQSPTETAKVQTNTVAPEEKLDASARRRILHAVAASLKEHYQDHELAEKLGEQLLANERRGDYNKVTDGVAFANLLSKELRSASQDPHMDVIYSHDPLRPDAGTPSPESVARYRQAMQDHNCTFQKVEMLSKGIGYFKLDSFPQTEVCKDKAMAAMSALNNANAIIFDLRDNRGGYPDMVRFVAAYLFDHPEFLYSPKEAMSEKLWTPSPVAGNKLADKRVFVLTSRQTASAAEEFCYGLKMLKRVTLVGDTTRGAAHAAVFRRIDPHFGMAVMETKPINPFGKSDWEGVGVDPDVRVKPEEALDRAVALAGKK